MGTPVHTPNMFDSSQKNKLLSGLHQGSHISLALNSDFVIRSGSVVAIDLQCIGRVVATGNLVAG